MFCPSCGLSAIPAEAVCRDCGSALPAACGACGSFNSALLPFCAACGHALTQRRTAALEALSQPLFQEQTHRLSDGQRKQVTVLFADLGGSMSIIEGFDPEDAEALLDAVVDIMVQAVHRFEGTVNQLLGDGIMALFGAPTAHEDHVVRAACAALAMQSGLRELRDESWQARGLRPEIRVGLNSGDAIVRRIRGDLGDTYRAIGPTTHVAARMEQLAARGTIRLTEAALRLGRGMLRVRALGPTAVKGLREPISTFELTGVATRTRFQATIARGLSPFVGRAAELDALEDVLLEPLGGRPRAVLLIGDPGIGKSRLCHELLRSPEAGKFRLLEASALSYARGSPHALLAALVKSMFEIDDEDGPEEVRAKVQAQFAALELDEERSYITLELLDLPSGSPLWKQLEPVQRLRETEQAVREISSAWCGDAPSIVLLEDLHWADPVSLSFIWSLFERPPGARTLVLGTMRPDASMVLPSAVRALSVTLDALAPSDAASLVRLIVGSADSLLRARRQVAENSQGNPLFIEEGARALLELGPAGSLAELDLGNRAAELVSVPPAVEALISTRLDRLPSESLALLQAAAVIGDDSPLEVLRVVADADTAAFEACFEKLASADLLYQTGPFRAPVFRFRHALLREVASRGVLRSRRRLLHARVVEAFERLYPSRLAEHWERLAEHAAGAEQWEKAARYHQRASTRAVSRRANDQAIAHLKRGIELSTRMEASPERDALAVDLRLIALAPLLPAGEHERIITLLQEAEAFARGLGDRARIAKVLTQLGTALWHTARYDAAFQAAQYAHAYASELGEFRLATAASHTLGMIHHAQGRFADSLRVLEQVVASLEGPLAFQQLGWAGYPSIFARTFLISDLAMQGHFSEAERLFQEAHGLAQAVAHPYSWSILLEEYGFCQILFGDFERGRQLCERAMAFCDEGEVLVMRAPVVARLGIALSHSGESRRALQLLEEGLEAGIQRAAGHYGEVFLRLALAEAALRSGELAVALDNAQRAEQETRSAGEHAYHVTALVQLADVLAASERRGEAGGVYDEALQGAQRLGLRPFAALAYQGKALWLAARGEQGAASACLGAAEALWRELHAGPRLSRLGDLQRTLDSRGS